MPSTRLLLTFALALPCALFACACTTTTEQKPANPGPATPAEPQPPPPCQDGTYRMSTGTCATFPNLSVARAAVVIAPARDHHTTMVIELASGPWLYVIGGTENWSTLHDDVQRAKIGPDGSLGAFESAGKLPQPRAGHCTVKIKDRLYLFGGIVGPGPSETSVVLELDAEGKVKSTAPGPAIPKAVMHLSCDQDGDNVFVIGGRGTNSRSTTLAARAKIGADGILGAFEPQSSLRPDRSHHASFVYKKRLYVIGGLTGDPTATAEDRKDVVMADILEDGSLGEWTAGGSLPTALSVSAAQLYTDAVYIFGGLEDGGFTDKIRRASIQDDGTLSPFATLPSKLPDPRGHVHQTPVYKDFIFSVGGKNNEEKSIGLVDVGRFQ